MARLWLHIGSPKTGSSYLQSFFFLNQALLAENGLVYLKPGPKQTNSNRFASLVAGKANLDEEKILKEVFRRADPKKDALISSEELYFQDPYKVAKALEAACAEYGYETKILVYFRRQDLFLDSFYSQRRKTGKFTGDILEFYEQVAEPRMDYNAILTRWAEVFGAKNIVPRIFENERFYDNDLCLDALRCAQFLTFGLTFARPKRTNTSPSRGVIEVLDALGEAGGYNVVRVQRVLETMGYPDLGGGKSFMTKMIAENVIEEYAPSNEAWCSKWGLETGFSQAIDAPEVLPESDVTPELKTALVKIFQAMSKTV